MKKLKNIRKATVADIESNGLLEEASLIHVLSYKATVRDVVNSIQGDKAGKLKAFLQGHIDSEIPIVGHNFICYDVPLLEKILEMDLSELMVIDTLRLSWAMNQHREIHGLDSFGKDYGIDKPKIDDWDNLTYREYKHRCQEDVLINQAMWEDHLEWLEEICTTSLEAIKLGDVDGVRESDNEVQYIDRMKEDSYTVDDLMCEYLEHLMFKGDMQRMREEARWKFDRERAEAEAAKLWELLEEAKETLEGVMGKVPVYAVQKKPKNIKTSKPKNMYKRNGELTKEGQRWQDSGGLSQAGQRWVDAVENLELGIKDEHGTRLAIEKKDKDGFPDPYEIKVLKGYKAPNINSPEQVKAFLFSHGWRPRKFKWVKPDQEQYNIWKRSGYKKHLKPKPRGVPQVNVDGKDGKELCQSVVELSEKVPEIMAYSKYTMIKHRYDTLQGMLRNASEDDHLKASCGGFTNTLRLKHRELVNLPGAKKPFAEGIRSSLTCEIKEILLGSDLSSLEDRVKHHFATPIDPEYVKNVTSSEWAEEYKEKYRPEFPRFYDPHIEMAEFAGLITEQQFEEFMYVHSSEKSFEEGLISEEEHKNNASKYDITHAKKMRSAGKTGNYALVYLAGVKTLAEAAGVSEEVAQKLFDAYWDIHNYVKVIADSMFVFTDSRGFKWQVNPINGFPYSLRAEKDRFSTLIQGTGAYIFDLWLDEICKDMVKRFGKALIIGEFHDEFITRFKDTPKMREIFTEITKNALTRVNKKLMLRREMGCDVQFGKRYSDIH